MQWNVVRKSLKAPTRQVLLALYAFLVNQLLSWTAKNIGFEFTEDQKIQILSYGTPIIWGLLSWLDRVLHTLGKQSEEKSCVVFRSVLTTGLTRF